MQPLSSHSVATPAWSAVTASRWFAWLTLAAALMTVLGLAAAVWRIQKQYHTPGHFTISNQGYCDFHNGVYYPSLAYARQVSPYSQHYADAYPVSRQVPPYSPLIIALHVPFALLPLQAAEIAYFGAMVISLLAIAYVLVRQYPGLPLSSMCLVTAVIVWSRPGHVTLFNGYFTFELVLGAFVALWLSKSHPWLAAVGLAVVSGKPTHWLPIVMLMAARGDWAAVWRGTLLSAVGGVAAMTWLTGASLAGVMQFLGDVRAGQVVHVNDPLESAVTNWIRLDLMAVIAKISGRDPGLTVMFGCMGLLLILPAVVLWRWRRRDPDAVAGLSDLSGSLILAASITAIYHVTYDALLLLAPLVGLAVGWAANSAAMGVTGATTPGVIPPVRRTARGHSADILLLICLLLPLFSPLSTQSFLMRLDPGPLAYQILTSTNSMAVLLAAGLLLWRLQCHLTTTAPSSPT